MTLSREQFNLRLHLGTKPFILRIVSYWKNLEELQTLRWILSYGKV